MVGTPGHTSDSLSFLLEQPGARPGLLTGDTVLGRGTTVVAHPDGRLGPYLDSLHRLLALVEGLEADGPGEGAAVLPGHGPALDDAAAALRGYLAHRGQRLDQVRAALAAGDRTAQQVVERVYADVDRVLWPAADAQRPGAAGAPARDRRGGRAGLTRSGSEGRFSGRGAPGGRRRAARRRAPRAGSSRARRSRPAPC